MKPSVRFEIFKRDEFLCRYCGRKSPEVILEVDHITPVSKGGTDEFDNLATACFECNRGKRDTILSHKLPELNLHEKTVLIAEREFQIQEYQYWKDQQHQRERKELARLNELCDAHFRYHLRKGSEAIWFLRKLGFHELEEIILWIIDHFEYKEDELGGDDEAQLWRLFCGCCYKRIKKGLKNAESDYQRFSVNQ